MLDVQGIKIEDFVEDSTIKSIDIGEYLISMKDGDSDNAILGWQNSRPIYNITTTA